MISDLLSYLTPGNFLYFDLLAAFTNALNGALLCQRPDHYRNRFITMVGILVFAVFGGIGGGVTRDVLLNDTPSSLTNPWYLILVFI
ncbi:MAG: TRIC cation channel family protein, partial [Anaerolineales bacterium]